MPTNKLAINLFNDEYKVLLTWEKGKASGPKGQNFVFLPGTHKGCRNCFMTEKGVWSTENASIFTTPERIDKVFTFQREMRGSSKPMVVEATHAEKPLTIVFFFFFFFYNIRVIKHKAT